MRCRSPGGGRVARQGDEGRPERAVATEIHQQLNNLIRERIRTVDRDPVTPEEIKTIRTAVESRVKSAIKDNLTIRQKLFGNQDDVLGFEIRGLHTRKTVLQQQLQTAAPQAKPTIVRQITESSAVITQAEAEWAPLVAALTACEANPLRGIVADPSVVVDV